MPGTLSDSQSNNTHTCNIYAALHHDPKQRKAQIEDGERPLQMNGRRWQPCKNTHSTEVEVAEQHIRVSKIHRIIYLTYLECVTCGFEPVASRVLNSRGLDSAREDVASAHALCLAWLPSPKFGQSSTQGATDVWGHTASMAEADMSEGRARMDLSVGMTRVEGGSTGKCASKTEVCRVNIRTKVITYI